MISVGYVCHGVSLAVQYVPLLRWLLVLLCDPLWRFSGTGIVGLGLASDGAVVTITDMEPLLPLMQLNAAEAAGQVPTVHCLRVVASSVICALLDRSCATERIAKSTT